MSQVLKKHLKTNQDSEPVIFFMIIINSEMTSMFFFSHPVCINHVKNHLKIEKAIVITEEH